MAEDKTISRAGEPIRYNQKHFDLLMQCSNQRDMAQWNSWRRQNPATEVQLDKAKLRGAWLQGANLKNCSLRGADLNGADLSHSSLNAAHLEGADIRRAVMVGAELVGTHLEKAFFCTARLDDANFVQVHMQGAMFQNAVVNAGTLIGGDYDTRTDFTAVALRNARVNPELRSALEGNIRRSMWQRWYGKHGILRWPVRAFWGISDYGQSTYRVILTFLSLALAFALVYWWFCGVVVDTRELQEGITPIEQRSGLAFARACYFSIVTMTTLGFGDVHAAHGCVPGYALLTIQVVLGYILLGALVTRSPSGYPAARSAPYPQAGFRGAMHGHRPRDYWGGMRMTRGARSLRALTLPWPASSP